MRMLRHYQERGLLIPARIDQFSGYRFYTSDQLGTAHLIVQLREAGFSIDAMSDVLDAVEESSGGSARIEHILSAQRDLLAQHRAELNAQQAALDLVTTTLKGHPEMTDVIRTTLPALTIASLRHVVPSYHDEGILWQEIMPLLQEAGVSFPAGGISGATFYDPECRDHDVDIEVLIQVTEPFTGTARLECRSVPERDVVMATLRGDYSQMPAVTQAIGAYIADHGLTTGPMFNIYRVSPAQNPDPSSWITDVCFPVTEASL